MKVRRIQHVFGSLVAAMSDRLRSFSDVRTLVMVLLVILTNLVLRLRKSVMMMTINCPD